VESKVNFEVEASVAIQGKFNLSYAQNSTLWLTGTLAATVFF
jgi:hypothetical protein